MDGFGISRPPAPTPSWRAEVTRDHARGLLPSQASTAPSPPGEPRRSWTSATAASSTASTATTPGTRYAERWARHAHVHVEHAPGAAGLGFAAGRGDLQGGGRERGVRDGHTGATHRHTETTLRQLMPRQAVGGHRLGEAVLPAGRPRQQLELRPRLLPRRPLPLRCVSRLGRPSEPHLRRHPDPGGPAPSGARAADWLMIQFSTAQ